MKLPGLQHLGDLECVFSGGMATVYRGTHAIHGDIAVKVPLPECQLERFEREINIMLAIGEHPSIVRTFDGKIGPSHHESFMLMEWVPFPTLEDVLDEGRGNPLPWQDALKIGYHTCVALQHAYSVARIRAHRDIKPNNIFVEMQEGRVTNAKLADFGIASPVENSKMTRMLILGRAEYMAPERMRAGADVHIDQRADVYSIGAVLYECMCGAPPFEGKDAMSVLVQALREEIVPLSQRNPNIPPKVSKIIMRSLAKAPQGRYEHMGALTAALQSEIKSFTQSQSFDYSAIQPVEVVQPSEALDILAKAPQGDGTPNVFDSEQFGAVAPSPSPFSAGTRSRVQPASSSILVGVILLACGFFLSAFGWLFLLLLSMPFIVSMLFSAGAGGAMIVAGLIRIISGIRATNAHAVDYDTPTLIEDSWEEAAYGELSVSSEPACRAQLRMLTGLDSGKVVDLYDYPLTCGRDMAVGLRLPEDDLGVSRVHAHIQYEDGVYVVVSVGRNGTKVNDGWVNGSRVLYSGDRIEMGRTIVEYVWGGAEL